MALTNKLTAIADSIREKTGSTNKLTLDEMPTAISNISSGGDEVLNEKLFNVTGNCDYKFNYSSWNWLINDYVDKIRTDSITSAEYMFTHNNINSIPFDINLENTKSCSVLNIFNSCENMEVPPYFNGKIGKCYGMFSHCIKLKYIPEDWATKIDWSIYNTNGSSNSISSVFKECYSLRKIPQNLIDNIFQLRPNASSDYFPYSNQYSYCYVLEELRNIPINFSATGNPYGLFSSMVSKCSRLKALTFKTNDDGTPSVVKFKSQTLDVSNYVGYVDYTSDVLNYNSGLTTATRITDDASYQSLKNNPDNWTTLIQYSRYNHDSAVETINSLPDTSAYGTNTIKFKGESGSATDGGAINTLTEAEIAVATAKGWTVTLV